MGSINDPATKFSIPKLAFCSHMLDVVDLCRTRKIVKDDRVCSTIIPNECGSVCQMLLIRVELEKIVEDDRVSTMRKKVWNQSIPHLTSLTLETKDGATKVGLRLLLIDYGSILRILANRQLICSTITNEEIAIHIRGVLDGSLDFHHNEKRFLGFSRGTSSLDADVHRKHMYEGHRVDNEGAALSGKYIKGRLFRLEHWCYKAIEEVKCKALRLYVPDKANMEHTIIPSTEAKSRKDGGTRSIALTCYGTTQVQNDGKHSTDEKLIPVEKPNVSEIKDPALRQVMKYVLNRPIKNNIQAGLQGGPFQARFQAREMPLHPDTDVNKKSELRHLEDSPSKPIIIGVIQESFDTYILKSLGSGINVGCKVIDKKAGIRSSMMKRHCLMFRLKRRFLASAKEKPDVAKAKAYARCTTERVYVEWVNAQARERGAAGPIELRCGRSPHSLMIIETSTSLLSVYSEQCWVVIVLETRKTSSFGTTFIPIPLPVAPQAVRDTYEVLYDAQNEVACLMLGSMSPDLQRTLENYKAYDMIQELKTMFEEQAKQFDTVKVFHSCKQEDGQSVRDYILQMKGYLDTLERLGYAMPKELGSIVELHAMLKLHEKGILKKAETLAVLAIREGKIQKDNKKPQGAKGKDKGKTRLAYAPTPKISSPPKREHPAKDFVCHHYKEVGHWKRNCPSYQAELKKRKSASIASTSCIFTIKFYAFSNKAWVYDTGCGTHICNTLQGLRESRKLKHRALSLYMGNGMRAAVEAIESFDLILPSGLIIVLDNCHFSPSVTRGVVSVTPH
ncbi:zinc finger, CCHC-type containing protein [Tanacetum coccineum]